MLVNTTKNKYNNISDIIDLYEINLIRKYIIIAYSYGNYMKRTYLKLLEYVII